MDRVMLVNSSGKEIASQPNYGGGVVKNDSLDNVNNCPVYIGTGGNIAVLLSGMSDNDTPLLFKNIANGSVLPFSIRRVMSTNTSVSDIVQFYSIPT